MKYGLILGFLTFPFILLSQIRKDQWLIGGNGFFSYSKSKELQFSSIQISPGVGYFFANKVAGGLRLAFSSDTYKWGPGKFRNSTKTVAPFIRYYFLPVDEKLNFFADGSFGYSWSKYKDFDPVESYKYRSYNIALMAGPSIFLNERTALEITVGYNYLSRGPSDSTITHKFHVGIGLQVHIGDK